MAAVEHISGARNPQLSSLRHTAGRNRTGPVARASDALELAAAAANPQTASPQAVLTLQRLYGNRAVGDAIQRTSIGERGGELDACTQSAIDRARGGGQALDQGAGAALGGALGADFSGVRVHTDSHADALNRTLSAKAFTTGSDVFFSQGAYQPHTSSGKQLLAHELTHVMHQGSAKPNTLHTKRAPNSSGSLNRHKPNKVQAKLTVGAADDQYEQEADQVARSIVSQCAQADAGAGAQRKLTARHDGGLGTPRRSGLAVQRYFTASNGVKLSDGGAFSVHPDGHTLFATPGAVTTSNEKLKSAGALVKLTNVGAPVVEGRTAVAPVIDGEAFTKKVPKRWGRLQTRQDPTAQYRTFADCFQTSATISGLHPGNASRLGDDTSAVMDLPTLGKVPVMDRRKSKEFGATDYGATAALSFYRAAFPHFAGLIREQPNGAALALKLAAAGDCNFAKGQILYKEILASEFMDLFVTTYGINEALAPRVGTAMVNVGDAPEALATRTKGGEQWNMHWAGIIMVDGGDYVSLENFALEMEEITAEDIPPNSDFLKAVFNEDGSVLDYAVERRIASDKTDLINEKWLFNMYGKASDSFHKVAGGNKKATKATMSLPVTRNQ